MKHPIAYLALTTSFLHAIPQEENLVARWSFEETLNNTVTERSARGTLPLSDGTFQGGFASLTNNDSIRGFYLRLDGFDDYVTVDDSSFFDTLDFTWSASAWFRADRAPSGEDRFFIFETTNSFPISLGLREGGNASDTEIQIFTQATGGDDDIGFEVPDAEITDWNHIVITYAETGDNAGILTAYLNGEMTTSESIESPVVTTATGFNIGTFRDADERFFPGDIDEVTLWDTTLTAAEAETFSSIVVNTINDEDDGDLSGDTISLREAIRYSTRFRIQFDPSLDGETIFLSDLGELTIERDLTIDASSLPNGITIDGNGDGDFIQEGNETRCFFVSDDDVEHNLSVTFNNLTIQNGFGNGSEGGNVYNSEDLTLSKCQVRNGRTSGFGDDGRGGGIYTTSGTLTLGQCTVSGNQTSGSDADGGGIMNDSGVLVLNSCTVSGNQTLGNGSSGGGIYSNTDFDNLFTRLDRCTLSGNSVGNGVGGGFYNHDGRAALFSCTISRNSAPVNQGGGVASFGDVFTRTFVRACIIAGNSGSDVDVNSSENSFSSMNLNLIGSGNALENFFSAQDVTGTSDPMLAPLGNYGGPTQTMHPLANSPAVFSSDNMCDIDQRGFTVTGPFTSGSVKRGPLNLVSSDAPDSTVGSLRSVIASITDPSAVIQFNPSITHRIELDGAQIEIDKSVFIDASNIPGGVIIDGGGNGDFVQDSNESRCLLIDGSDDQINVTLHSLTLQNGSENNIRAGANLSNRGEIVNLVDCLILNGRGISGGRGGGIYNDNGGKLTLNSCTVTGNQTQFTGFGGGIFSLLGDLTLNSCTISENQTQGNSAHGGGIYSGRGSLTLNSCTVSGNQTLNDNATGGGIYNWRSDCIINSCTISGNQTLGLRGEGGGIYSEEANLTLNSCTVSGNQTSGSDADGGGIFNENGTAILTHCTISENMSLNGEGSGIASSGNTSTSTEVQFSIIAGNGSSDLALVDGGHNSFSSLGNNVIGSGNAITNFNGTGDLTNISDPKISPLGYHGGPTFTMHPLADSPAILMDEAATIQIDQRGLTLVGPPTIGAVKRGPVSLVTNNSPDNTEGSFRSVIAEITEPGAVIEFDTIFFNDVNNQSANLIQLTGSALGIRNSVFVDASNITGGVIIDGGSNGDLVADGNESRCLSITSAPDTTIDVSLHSLTLQNGHYSEEIFGGANLFNSGQNVSLTNCHILDGIHSGNTDFRVSGGGILNREGNLILSSCTVSGNQTLGNTASGGGIDSSGGMLTLNSCIVSGNQTQGGTASGGGIHSTSPLILNSCTVSGNQTLGESAHGGGISNSVNNLTLNSCTISGNQTAGATANGGGIFSFSHLVNHQTRLTNCTLSGNRANNAAGGGFYSRASQSVLKHCTISENFAPDKRGGGLASFGEDFTITEVEASIISGNSGSDVDLVDGVTNTFISLGDNMIGSGNALDSFSEVGDITGIIDPKLAPLGDYGGPTETMPPLSDSPAIDAAVASTSVIDQRGFLRVGIPDIGAVDFNPFPFDIADFDNDEDNDGVSNGLEFILGTDHETTDLSNPRNPALSFESNGERKLLFGKAADLPPGITLRVMRSTTLESGSFVEVANYNSTNSSTSNDAFVILIGGGSEEFSFTDPEELSEAFYRLEAQYAP